MIDLAELPARLAEVRERIAAAAARAGRRPEEVTLVGVTKTHPAALVEAAWRAGILVLGENRVQEALGKSQELAHLPPPPEGPEWHLIGPLQSNKVRAALNLFRTIHSIDRPKIAEAVDQEATARGLQVDGFLEINVGAEESKHGFAPAGLAEAVRPLARFNGTTGLRIVGLMAVPPFAASLGDNPEASRRWFVRLRELSQELAVRPEWAGFPARLSMGMSHDYEAAIEEGATHVRVGTALFGARAARG
ncbi:MAG TPA: YggS family pyridoxal phosphate-dependent enzyme [Thermoanaerobaculia bacterium]|nr:YggS family pyridoxal phosphate-dependent enzyme [Thermoanaerobaculia bacterium]